MTADLIWLAGLVTAMLAALAGLGKAGVSAWRFLRKLAQFVEDWFGEEPRDGLPDERRRRGVLERLDLLTTAVAEAKTKATEAQAVTAAARAETAAELAELRDRIGAIEAQLQPNGGGSLRDVVDRIASPEAVFPSQPNG